MSASESLPTNDNDPSANSDTDAIAGRKRLLVLEPEALVSWSLVTYLAEWFVVVAADCERSAAQLLADRPVDALVISDDVEDQAAQRVVALAKSLKPSVRVVRTVSGPTPRNYTTPDTLSVEKPFELSSLAALLGVSGAAGDSNR